MANERNKILPYALSAIEGVNIQSQEDYSASSETTDGVSTGLANGNNFNKLAKQVSIMSSSLAEFIVNTLAKQTISDTNSIEEISSALNSAILKLIKNNEPVIPGKAGITVINDNNTDITSFNQIKENGIYYIYKQLSDGPSHNGEAIKYGFIHLIVINISIAAQNIEGCLQMTSFGPLLYTFIPGNIGSMPMLRPYGKTSKQWGDWTFTYGITFINNNIGISDFEIDKLRTRFPIIATDNTFPDGNNTFMYSATKEQMRAQLGIVDSPDLTDYFNKTTDKINLSSQVTGQLKNANIANGAVTSAKIASKTITASNISDNTITAEQIANNAITEFELDSNAVTNAKIANGAVTDKKFSGILSISKGGTGNATGLNYKNYCGIYQNICSMLGIENTPRTIQEFWNKVPAMLDITFLATGDNITDLPTKNYYYINITKQDGNLSWIKIKSWRSNTTYLAYVANNIVSTWVLVRKSNGSIPAELIPPTVLKYTNDQGTWTETKLSDGTTMLEGWGETNIPTPSGWFKVNQLYSKQIQLPKACKTNSCEIVSNGKYIDLSGYIDNTITYSNASWDGGSDIPTKIHISTIFYRQPPTPSNISFVTLNISWIFKGILA